MGQILLVRHGQASWGADDYDVLSELGWSQSRLLGQSFAARGIVPDRVVTGSMRRHRETAEACAEAAGWATSPERATDPGWDEYDHVAMLAKVPPPHPGELNRREFQEWVEAGSQRWTSSNDDYEETFGQFGTRVGAALERLTSAGTTVVFSSGGPISWTTAALLADGPARVALWRRLNVVCANTAVTRIITGRRGTTLVSFNEHAHLDGTDLLSYR